LEKAGVLWWYFDGENVVERGQKRGEKMVVIRELKTCHLLEIFFRPEGFRSHFGTK
jgi:hypothetical protein